ncbi:MAG: hydrolase [Dehalococcoidia bacterium]
MTQRKRKRVPVGDDGQPVLTAAEPVAEDDAELPEECDCARLDAEDWDRVESDWSDIAFLKGSSSAVLGVPTGFAGTRDALMRRAEEIGARVPADPMALLGSGQFRRPVWLEVEDAPGHKEIVRPGGVAYTRLVEAPLGTIGKLVREAEMEARVKYGRSPDSTWLWYLTCRVCSKERNFETLIVAHYRDGK